MKTKRTKGKDRIANVWVPYDYNIYLVKTDDGDSIQMIAKTLRHVRKDFEESKPHTSIKTIKLLESQSSWDNC